MGDLREGPLTVAETADSAYAGLVGRVRSVVQRAVPSDATVVVVTKGDRQLLELGGRQAWHFPQRADGVYAGHYPPDSATAIGHLEVLREKGGEFLVFPSTALWWLEHYSAFNEHLESKYRVLVRNEVCVIFALFEPGLRKRPTGGDVDGADQARFEGDRCDRTAADYVEERLVDDLMILFDRDHYGRQTGIQFSSTDEALVHYLEAGFQSGFDPHPLFDSRFYLQRHPNLRRAGTNPLIHFLTDGAANDADPNPYFDTSYYYAQGPGLRHRGINPLVHYIRSAGSTKAYRPNPLFGNVYYLRVYKGELPGGMTPLAHYLELGWREGCFMSAAHQRMMELSQRSSRSSLLRGNWRDGTVLAFSYGGPSANADRISRLAEELAGDYHLDTLVVARQRPASWESPTSNAKLLVLEDFQTACEIFRPAALRLLTKSLTSPEPLFVITEVPETTGVLRAAQVPTYVVLDSPSAVPGPILSSLFDQAERVLIPSSSGFHAAAETMGRYPTNVALWPRGTAGSDEGSNGDQHSRSIDRSARSLLELVERDLGVKTPPSQPIRCSPPGPTRTVIIPCSDWGVSGVNASLEAVGRELINLDWDVQILFTRDRDVVVESSGGGTHLPGVPYRFLDRDKPGVAGMWEALIADVQTRAPCIYFMAYDFLANSCAPALTEDVGIVSWVQADDGDYYEQAYRLGRYCNAVVCVSEWISDKVAALNPVIGARSHVIYNSSVWEHEVATRKARKADRMRIMYSGRLVQYQKRVLDYIDLATALDETGIPYTITLIGQFSGREDVMDAFHSRAKPHLDDGRIVLPGRMTRSGILQQLSEHDFFVLLSDFEGFPLSVVEAMARGCVPVVAGTDSGIPEIIAHGENGLVVADRDYRKWADLLTDRWTDRPTYLRMSRNARTSVRGRLTVEHVGKRFDRLLWQVAEEISARTFQRPPSLHWGEARSPAGDVLPPPSLFRPLNIAGLR